MSSIRNDKMTSETQDRRIETQYEINAPVADVWRALTDAEWLTNWFPLEARITPGTNGIPGVGGSIWMAWGGHGSETEIDIWEENKHLRLIRSVPADPDLKGTMSPLEVAQDFYLETQGGSTVLRLVHAGFSTDASWDWEYNATTRGWKFELGGLKHYLEKHNGVKRIVVQASHILAGISYEVAWSALFGAAGLLSGGSIEGLRQGDHFDFTTSAGQTFRGEAQIINPPQDFTGTLENFNDARLRVAIDKSCDNPGEQSVTLFISTYDLPQEKREALQQGLKEVLESMASAVPASS